MKASEQAGRGVGEITDFPSDLSEPSAVNQGVSTAVAVQSTQHKARRAIFY